MTLLAAFATLLHRLSGQRELIVGTPVRGRDRPEFETLMGFFVNALPLRIELDPAQPFIELVRQVRHTVLDAFTFPDVPFEHLVRTLGVPRDASRSPLFQAFFSFQDARQRPQNWGSLAVSPVHLFQRGSAEDLGLWFLEHEQGLSGGLSCNSDLFEAATGARFAERLQTLLAAAIAAPQTPLGRLDMLPSQEAAALAQWNDTGREWAAPQTLPALLAQAAQQHADQPAL
eukprot:gene61055-83518_t